MIKAIKSVLFRLLSMKVQYASDLHLEFCENRAFLRENPLEVAGDILLLAGDIMYIEDCNMFCNWASKNYKQVLAVPGNHEFYFGNDLKNYGNSFKKPICDNVAYYHNKVVRIEDTDFILSTFWSYIGNRCKEYIENRLNDFHRIYFNDSTLTVDEYNAMHKESRCFIEQAVKDSKAEHIVVVTHHSPSLLTIATEHLTSPLCQAFASDRHYLMEDGRIDYWVYGHSHTNINCKVFNTEVVCNQLGYVANNGQMAGFSLNKCFEL